MASKKKDRLNSSEKRQLLNSHIWDMANQVRGNVKSWDFKNYVLSILFYRFLSENFVEYISYSGLPGERGYAEYDDSEISDEIKTIAVEEKGFFIYPSQLFTNVIKSMKENEDFNQTLPKIFREIENSAEGTQSEETFKGIFGNFSTTSNDLGQTVGDKNERLMSIMNGIASIDFGDFQDNNNDIFGDVYEFLISRYTSESGAEGGDHFTPPQVSKLMAMLAVHGQAKINKVYDPTCGSGSLLLKAKQFIDENAIDDGFFGQDNKPLQGNLSKMNMLLHNINYDKFHIHVGNTLYNPAFLGEKPFDVIVSNPPFSQSWEVDTRIGLQYDPRFEPAHALAPKEYSDFAFVMHALHYLSSKGRAVIASYPGVLYRGKKHLKKTDAELLIREYLVKNNYVEAVIQLAPNLFFNTPTAVNLLLLSKRPREKVIKFIYAGSYFKNQPGQNYLADEHINKIMYAFEHKDDIEHVSRNVSVQEIEDNKWNLTVTNYIKLPYVKAAININALNRDIAESSAIVEKLRHEVDKIVQELEGSL